MRIKHILLIISVSCLMTGCTMEQIAVNPAQPAQALTAGANTPAPQKAAPASQTAAKMTAGTQTTAAQTTATQTTAAQTTAAQTSAAALAAESTEDWMLRLANRTHPVGDYVPEKLVTLKNGTQVDARMYPYLQQMYDAMRSKGLKPFTREGYRTYEAQQDIMESRIQQHRNEGLTAEAAKERAEAYVAVPGTSEHQLGLAVDINSENGDSQRVYEWLKKHAHEYGFIQRYPEGKEDITGIQAEAWHYRFVGLAAAEEMYASGQTLEEYLGET